jgi:hypothetical protein
MLAFALCLAFGVLLAQSFRVFILAPATLLIIVMGMTGDSGVLESLWIELWTTAMVAIALQAGYLIGISPWMNQPPLIDRT